MVLPTEPGKGDLAGVVRVTVQSQNMEISKRRHGCDGAEGGENGRSDNQ